MSQHRLFLSYSRQQLYFAEAVAQALQKQGVDVWFDLQRLEPGTAWYDEIQKGLDESTGLILVVSQSALESPYVAAEWLHALEHEKPIYLVLFEPVDLNPITLEINDQPQQLPLDKLSQQSVAVIDARRNFGDNMRRLYECATESATYRDPFPARNRFQLPTRLPLAVAFVSVIMIALTLITLYVTATLLIEFIPMTVVGLIAAGYLGWQSWLFLRRESYSGARICLVIAPFIVALFAFWFLPFTLIALYLALYSNDVHRWSPLAQGNNQRDSIQHKTHRRGQAVVTTLIFMTLFSAIDPLLALPFILIVAFIANRRQRLNFNFAAKGKGAVSYKIYAARQDANVAVDVESAMGYAGHRRIPDYSSDTPDYHLVMISNYSAPPAISRLEEQGGKIVSIVASSFQTSPNVKDYQRYQWVDYRRQDPERLVAMALDIQSGHETNSFSARIVPQEFQRLLIPRRVFLFAAITLVFYNLTVAQIARAFAVGQEVSALGVIYVLASLWVSVTVLQRVLQRRITIETIALINIALAFGGNLVFLISSLFTPPAGYERDNSDLVRWLIINAVAVVVAYFISKYQLKAILQWWLPHSGAGGDASVDSPMLRRTVLVSGVVVALITVSFFGQEKTAAFPNPPLEEAEFTPIELDGGMRVETPAHWSQIHSNSDNVDPHVRNIPIAAIIRKANGPLNEGVAISINAYFQSGLFGQSLIIASLVALGESIQEIFDTIIRSLGSGSNVTWRPTYYGFPVFSTAYSDGGDNVLAATFWAFADPYRMTTIRQVVADTAETINLTPVSFRFEASFADHPYAFVNYTAFENALEPGLLNVLVSFDTPAQDYFLLIKGSSSLIAEQSPLLEHVIASANFTGVNPIVRTPTPTATRFLSPTPSFTPTITPTPTITLTPSITWTPSITPTPSPTITPSPTSTPLTTAFGEYRGAITIGGGETWRLEGERGDLLTIEVLADRPANDGTSDEFDPEGFDSTVSVRDPNRVIIAENDDSLPNEISKITNSLIENLELPLTGIYEIEVRGWDNKSGGAYILIIREGVPMTPTPSPTPP